MFTAAVHHTHIVGIVDCTHVHHVIATIDGTHVGSATASFEDLVTLHITTGDILVEGQLRPPLDMVTVAKERELSTSHMCGTNQQHRLGYDDT